MSLNASCVHRNEPVEVDVHDLLPLLERQVLERDAGGADARVVEQEVEAAERLLRAREERPDRLRVGDVGGDDERPRFADACLRIDLLQRLLAAPGERDVPPFTQERERDRLADAPSRARHDRHLLRRAHR